MALHDNHWKTGAARSSLERLLPRLEKDHAPALGNRPEEWAAFKERLANNWDRLFGYLHELYGWQYDFFYTLELVLDLMVRHWLDRPEPLRMLDDRRSADPTKGRAERSQMQTEVAQNHRPLSRSILPPASSIRR